MTASIQRVANAYLVRQGAKALGGAAARLMREAAAGAKPLIDVKPLGEVLTALGWEVTPAVEGWSIEGRPSQDAREKIITHLESKVKKRDTVERSWGPVEVDMWKVRPFRGYAIFDVAARDDKTLGRLKKALDPWAKKTRLGEISTEWKGGYGGSREPEWRNKPSMRVWVKLNVSVWYFKNPKAKGTLRKPLSLKQQYGDNLKLKPMTGIKAGRFWGSLYTRGVKEAAEAYLVQHGKSLPSPEELETPEEKVKRRFDQEVKAKLLSFTDKQFKSVVKDYEEFYTNLLNLFLDQQERAYKEWADDVEYLRSKGSKVFKDFPGMTGTYKKPTRWKQDMQHISRFLERDEERSSQYPFAQVFKRKGGWKSEVKKQAEQIAREIRDGFVRKNTMKLSAIVTGKGNLKSIEILNWARSNFEGNMLFTFKDGSSFEVRNKTVTKLSSRGKWFAQYPTTFHKVVMPDGKKMPSPSEKRMIDVFAAV